MFSLGVKTAREANTGKYFGVGIEVYMVAVG